jgi:hypothetical protein
METSRPLRILFLTDDREDYLADGVLHGLRRTPGVDVVDHPRKTCLYAGGIHSTVAPGLGVRGGGFNLYGTLGTEDEPERTQIFRQLEGGWFDLVILGNVWRQWGQLLDWSPLLGAVPLALLDGDDDGRLYPGSGTHLRRFGPWRSLAALLARPDCLYFKREWQGPRALERARLRWFGLGGRQVRPISFSIPEEKLLDPAELEGPRPQRFPTHVVDREVQRRVGGQTGHAFLTESAYNADLRRSRFGITTRRSGWDCLRHLELAAQGCVLCFRDLASKPATCAPHGLHGGNSLSYSSAEELLRRLEALSADEERRLRRASWEWARDHTTRQAAARLLASCGWPGLSLKGSQGSR